jgi:hypothetical protein
MRGWITAAVCALLMAAPASGQVPAAPTALTSADFPWDNGTRMSLTWGLSPDDSTLLGYAVRRRADGETDLTLVEIIPPGTSGYTVTDLNLETAYLFEVSAIAQDNAESPAAVTPAAVTPSMQWFDGTRVWFLLTLIVFSGAVIAFIRMARKGKQLNIRKIAGLEAIDEAVGRATEMGRACLYIPGIQDMNDIQTIASMSILSHVAKTAAEYDAKIEVPNIRSLVMTAARETVEAAFLSAGRPDAFNPDLIYYVTDEQFGYVAYVQGMMVRDKPAACFYFGSFFAESLILAEMGNSVGAIQVAGTAQPAQLPFFVAACDYTLIGEEFFAASAYLSGEPDQLGSLKGQDVGKLIVAAGIIVGVALSTIVVLTESPFIQSLLDYFTERMLT